MTVTMEAQHITKAEKNPADMLQYQSHVGSFIWLLGWGAASWIRTERAKCQQYWERHLKQLDLWETKKVDSCIITMLLPIFLKCFRPSWSSKILLVYQAPYFPNMDFVCCPNLNPHWKRDDWVIRRHNEECSDWTVCCSKRGISTMVALLGEICAIQRC